MKLHCFMQMGLWIWLAVLPQLDPSLISASFCSFCVPSLSSPFIFPFSSLSLSDFANHEILLLYDSKDGARRGKGEQRSESANHNKRKKKKEKQGIRVFQLRRTLWSFHHHYHCSHRHYHHCVWCVFVCQRRSISSSVLVG